MSDRQQMRETMRLRRGLESLQATQLRVYIDHIELVKKEALRLYAHRLDWDQHTDTMEMATMRLALATEEANKPFWRRWFGSKS